MDEQILKLPVLYPKTEGRPGDLVMVATELDDSGVYTPDDLSTVVKAVVGKLVSVDGGYIVRQMVGLELVAESHLKNHYFVTDLNGEETYQNPAWRIDPRSDDFKHLLDSSPTFAEKYEALSA